MKDLLSNTETDELGEKYIAKYYKTSPIDSLCVDIEGFATECLGLDIRYCSFAEEDLETLGFLSDGVTPVCVSDNGHPVRVVFPLKTVIIDRALLSPWESGRKRFTIAHESAHYLLERLSGTGAAKHYREFDPARHYKGRSIEEILSFDESRADRLAAALLMPRFNVEKALTRFAGGEKFRIYGETIMTPADKIRLQIMADVIGVSFSALKIRLKELGLLDYRSFDEFVAQDLQEGDFDDSDIEYDRRYGKLSPEQTYLIHRSRRESARAAGRIVRCPACGFRMADVTVDINGAQHLKCRKCGFNEPLNFAYFRRCRHIPCPAPGHKFISAKKKR